MKYTSSSLRLLTEAIDLKNLPDLKEYMSRSEKGSYVWHNDENGLRYTWSPVNRYVRAYINRDRWRPGGTRADVVGQILAKNVTDYSVAKAVVLRRFARDIESGRKNKHIKPFSTSPNFGTSWSQHSHRQYRIKYSQRFRS